eukprot:151434_1
MQVKKNDMNSIKLLNELIETFQIDHNAKNALPIDESNNIIQSTDDRLINCKELKHLKRKLISYHQGDTYMIDESNIINVMNDFSYLLKFCGDTNNFEYIYQYLCNDNICKVNTC